MLLSFAENVSTPIQESLSLLAACTKETCNWSADGFKHNGAHSKSDANKLLLFRVILVVGHLNHDAT